MDADVGVEGAGSYGKRVPLGGGDRGDIEHQPLARFVFHARFRELDLHGVVRVADDFCDLGRAPRIDFAIEALDQVDAAAPELPAPAFITNAVVPKVGPCEGGEWGGAIANEAAGGVGVEAEEKRDKEVVRIPEGLEGLLSDSGVRGGVHE